MAVNAAAAAPNGLCAAVCGDADYILVNGGPRGYGASAGGHTEYLPIDGDPETLNFITGEPQGGMYVAWSSDSEYLAATSDSLHAVAVWRVTVEKEPPVVVAAAAAAAGGGGARGMGGGGGGGSRSVPSSPARPAARVRRRGRGGRGRAVHSHAPIVLDRRPYRAKKLRVFHVFFIRHWRRRERDKKQTSEGDFLTIFCLCAYIDGLG